MLTQLFLLLQQAENSYIRISNQCRKKVASKTSQVLSTAQETTSKISVYARQGHASWPLEGRASTWPMHLTYLPCMFSFVTKRAHSGTHSTLRKKSELYGQDNHQVESVPIASDTMIQRRENLSKRIQGQFFVPICPWLLLFSKLCVNITTLKTDNCNLLLCKHGKQGKQGWLFGI